MLEAVAFKFKLSLNKEGMRRANVETTNKISIPIIIIALTFLFTPSLTIFFSIGFRVYAIKKDIKTKYNISLSTELLITNKTAAPNNYCKYIFGNRIFTNIHRIIFHILN